MDMNIISSVDSAVFEKGLLNVSDRYFNHKYCNKIWGIEEDVKQRVSFHSNKVCMLSLADNHPAMLEGKVLKVMFDVDDETDRSKNVASGKGKRGAQKLNEASVICLIQTEKGVYPVYSCIKGKLIEVNENLLENPNLLIEKPTSDGYIALLLPVLSLYRSYKESMLDYAKYCENDNKI